MFLIGTKPRKLNESGQAVVEYILVMCISVFIIVTFVYQFSTAFRVWATNFFGEYVACLMETGELPGQTGGACASSMVAFDIKNGKTATGKTGDINTNPGGSGGGLTGSTGSSSSGNGASGGGSKSGSKGASTSSSSSSSNSSSGSGSNSGTGSGGETLGSSGSDSGSAFGSRSSTRKTTKVGSTSQQAGGDKGKGKEGLKALNTTSSSYAKESAGGSGRRTALGRNFSYYGQEKDDVKVGAGGSKPVAKNDGDNLKSKKVSTAVVRAPAAAPDGGDTSFSVGGFVKVLLIAAILIAIFVLFGGQLLAISKGGEK